ncbi:hypothetical protein JR316_0007371 [Psilocybe cubensis]|uniref:Uncharacterized protein n=1 Tax=Psilocybe cubensis TaxID=181762 RepID=A0ACB8GYS2_PSICU|nr:hypothetical protein JR316_0007371 [Psilocybe cubensis]KAH9480771.1 hypothetical protein JR316_0007371 [Psilocybe cubensis]
MGAADVEGRFVGPMPIKNMLKLLPVTDLKAKFIPDFAHDCFSALDVQEEKKEMCDSFLVNSSTYSYADSEALLADVVAYRQSVAVPQNGIDYMELELAFDIRTTRDRADPFDHRATKDSTGLESQSESESQYPFEARGNANKVCRRRICNYAKKWLSAQHRVHCYVVYVGDPYTRIIRFDRAGALVSEQINYRIDGHLLLEFLWRHSQTTDEARGHDTTVRIVPLDDEKFKLAQSKLYQWRPQNDNVKVLEMDIPTNAGGVAHTVYVWGALSEPYLVTGRATRGYPAWDPNRPEGEDIVFLKDSWRSCAPGMEKETDILQTLNKHGVRNVPQYLYGDDIPGHMTITQDYAAAEWNAGGVAKDVIKRVHIRFVEDVVGLPLWEFENPRQLVVAIHDAIIAHQDAYQLCGILHRDVSLGNILRRRDGKGGVLNDWDLAARYNIETHTPLKQQSRSGTWQFMSIGLLKDPSKVHHCIDDAESFIWALLYCTMRYMKTSIVPIRLQNTMGDLFDQVNRGLPGELNTGGAGKLSFVISNHFSFKGFVVNENEPLTDLIDTLFDDIVYTYRCHLMELRKCVKQLMVNQQYTSEQAHEIFDRKTSELGVQLYQLLESTLKESLNKDWPNSDLGWHDYLELLKTANAKKHPVDSAFSSVLDGSPLHQPRKRQKHSNDTPYLSSGLQRTKHQAVPYSGRNTVGFMGAVDLQGRFVGPMPIEDMLELLPVAELRTKTMLNFAHNYFTALDVQGEKKEMSDSLIQRVIASQAIPGFQLINLSKYSYGDSEALVPDVVVYKQSVTVPQNNIDYTELELAFDIRNTRERADPFDCRAVKTIDSEGQSESESQYPFEARGDANKVCRRRICNYAKKWLSAQHRVHCYVVYVGDPYTRIIRFDRAGALVSEQINYRIDGHLLLEFLWRHSQTTDEARGHDTTVRIVPLDDEKVKLAQSKLNQWRPQNDNVKVLEMDIPTNAGGVAHTVYVWGALSEPYLVTGRATRGYPAWDPNRPEGEDIVFLKDSWRSCAQGTEKETDILQILNKHGVRNVPQYLYGDDIAGHMTITQDYAAAEWNAGGVTKDIIKRVHIRFVEDIVGLPLWEFENPKQLVEAVHDAVIAHQDAYQLCGILHRDVSIGNILRRRDGAGGVLNDWDLAARYNIETHTPLTDKKHQSRAGTWQFMSIGLLRDPSKVHYCIDDAESFIWALLYCTMRYMKTSIVPIRLQNTMGDLFDQVNPGVPGELNTGGAGKQSFVTADHSSFRDFVVNENEPLTDLIDTLFEDIVYTYRCHLLELRKCVKQLMVNQQYTSEQAHEIFDRKTSELGVQLYQLLESTLKESLNKDWPNSDLGWHDYLELLKTANAKKHPVHSAFSSVLDGSPSRQPRKRQKHSNDTPYLSSGSSSLVSQIRPNIF